jgi:iron-sulfur cluster assembly protein
LALALDEPTDKDEKYQINGFTFIVDKVLMEKAKPIKVDYLINGFKLDCGLDFGPDTGCSSCSTSGSCH